MRPRRKKPAVKVERSCRRGRTMEDLSAYLKENPDNGPEFSAPTGVERAEDGTLRTKVFYCDPYQSNQKASCENNHRFIRMILPKGTSMNGLTQDDADLMMSHINSYARKALGGQTPVEVFSRQHKGINGLLEKLGAKVVQANDINPAPSLPER